MDTNVSMITDMKGTYKAKKDAVFEVLREEIISGRLAPGTWLRQNDLAEKFGVSATPVREALAQLAARGLVQYSLHKGVRVADFDLEEAAEIYQIRAVLEALAIKAATLNLGATDLEELERLVRQMLACSEQGDDAGLRCANRDYHRLIAEACGMPRLIQTLRNLQVDFPTAYLGLVPGRRTQALEEHQAILEALKCNDAQRARALMQEHLENAAIVLQSLRKTTAD